MAEKSTIPFDPKRGDDKAVIGFMRSFFEHARSAQRYKHEEFQRIYELYKQVQDMTNRDQYRANIFVPILYWIIETIMPAYTDAILGVRPYIPIEANQKRNSTISEAQTQLLDVYLDESNFFEESLKWIKYTPLYGLSFLEATPDYENKRIVRNVPRIGIGIDGQPILLGMERVEEMQRLFKLKIRTYAPWQIYADPLAHNLEDCRGIIKFRGMISKRQLKKMIERNPAGFENFDPEKLDQKGAMEDLANDNWSRKMASDIGVTMPIDDNDVGVWLSYESEERYIDLWNFGFVLRDIDNPYKSSDGGHGKINLTRIINNVDPNEFNDWFGIGEGRPIESLAHALNENWNQTFDNHNMNQHGVFFYDPDAINVDQLIMIGGNRIPMNLGPGQTPEQAVYERPQRSLPADHYNIPHTLERFIDQTAGISFPGMAGGGKEEMETAREAILVRQSKDARMKFKIKLGEKLGLGDFARKVIGHIEQFATPDDIVAKIGLELASQLPSVNPEHLDGGYTFAMKGSARMADAMIKRQDAKDLLQLLRGWLTINQEWLANWTLEKFEVSDADRRKAVLPDEHALALEAQLAQMGIGRRGGAETTRLISSGKQIGGNPAQTVSGRDMNEKLGMQI